ncbi:protein of unknown function [Trichlorobacter ammonificans]|uniref:Uncharacterized protein n=1 Tax=Trichlorobacter ammonificans TaxID=2916410 RepID=A0ABN8HKU9_9BACT|nr:protein of unknown function [Trichlorobacter ammonificans]
MGGASAASTVVSPVCFVEPAEELSGDQWGKCFKWANKRVET